MNQGDTLDLTPSPRVLRMLGQVDFKPWQCLAELIDNSVDAFLSARESLGVMFPQVNVEISAVPEIRAKTGEIRISDNGPGMPLEHLEAAVKAGFSGNNSIDKLGLFGMGFNVATARLGNRTEVWTTRAEDDAWYGVRIDFDEMERSGSFDAPLLSRRKTATEVSAHGTEIVISKLDQDRALYLRSGAGLRFTREKLSRVYNRIMRELSLKVVIGGGALTPREFCVWDQSRFVETRTDFGRIPAYIPIDQDLGDRQYCEDCWNWLSESESVCPVCGTTDRLQTRSRRVAGWVGIQRFFDQADYGIDLIRNGRIIEERSKSFFSWQHPDTGESVPEYPLEQTHWGGRIVGELSIDFVPLASHQKDAFDKNSMEWRLAEEAVRGNGPLLVQIRKNLGLPERNDSPLGRLHAGYRRGSPPGLRTLVPGDSRGAGINEEPKRWAVAFWEGDPEYQTDERWWAAVVQAEGARNRKGADVPTDLEGPTDLLGGSPPDTDVSTDQQKGADAEEPSTPPAPRREADSFLSGSFELPDLPGAPRLEAHAERVLAGGLQGNAPIEFSAMGSRVEFTYDPRHALFTRTLLEPVDCLVEELAYQLLQRSSVTQRDWPLSVVTQQLRERYFPWSLPSFDHVREAAEALFQELIEHFVEALSGIAPLSENVLSSEERAELAREVARVDRQGEERVAEVIRTGLFPRYLGAKALPEFVERWPELVLDGRFLAVGFTDVGVSMRSEVVRQVATALRDLLWVLDPSGAYRGGDEWRSFLARAAGSERLLSSWKA